MTASEAKAGLRRKLRAEGARRSPAELSEGSRAICERIGQQSVWRKAGAVLFYAPLPGEPDVRPLIELGLQGGKTILLPRYDAASGSYQVCRITEPRAQLAKGEFGILEPSRECPVGELNKLDLALVPGIGFSLNGCRLGRGKGYFDRMLSEVRGWKCGVAFDWQVTVEIPTERHDIRLNSIVTPTRWHVVRS
jgi:5-formyltetrahydrofolate cyclo-ligase